MKMLAGIIALVCLAGCGDKGDDSSGADLVGDPDAGATVFANTCADVDCHGPDGSGSGKKSDAADLADEVPARSDAEIKAIIRNGQDLMAPLKLTNQEIADVISYLRQEFGG
jgi:mono/diheme cytochrome c family protein